MCDVWEERSKPTAIFYREQLSDEMGTDLFRVAATRLMKREEWFPPVSKFVSEARRIERHRRKLRERRAALERAERELERIQREARELLDDAALEGKNVAEALRDGTLDLTRTIDGEVARAKKLPGEDEDRMRSAGRVDDSDDSDDRWGDFR